MKTKFLSLLMLCILHLAFCTNLWASNVITYTATSKLPETEYTYGSGLHTNAFNVSIYSHTFSYGQGTITFLGEVTSIGESAFLFCSSLTSITIPNSVTSIGNYAFYDCSGLTSVTIPNSVTSIGEGAFAGCSGLTSVVVESGNSTYDSRNNCNAIIETATNTLIAGCKNTIIPNSVTSIGNYAFYDCSGLTSVTIPNSVTSIGLAAFYGCSSLTSVTIPNSVTSIGNYAFFGCSGLTSITIPNSVTSIGNYAFYGCSGLTSITIPNSVTLIGSYAFWNCSGLTSVTIGNSVTSIGENAFVGCTNVGHVYCAANVPPKCPDNAFESMGQFSTILHVSANSVDMYKIALGWRFFFNILGDYDNTALEDMLLNNQNTSKFIQNGQLYILRDGKTYTMQGTEIK